MEYTRTLKETVDRLKLKEIHRGYLSYCNNRYTASLRRIVISNLDVPDRRGFTFTAVFSYFNKKDRQWFVFEKTGMTRDEAKEVADTEFSRKLWDSGQMFMEDGERLYQIMSVE